MPSMSKENHLFIFEGKAEPNYHESLESNFLGDRFSIKCIFDAEIYQLYQKLKEDEFDSDIVAILKERASNADVLKDYKRDDFAYVYLFFDYDAHSTMAGDEKIRQMLEYFDNETERGKLFLSYPMLEAIKHYKDFESFKDILVKCKKGTKLENTKCPYKNECEEIDDCCAQPHYKEIAASDNLPKLNDIKKYSWDVWAELIRANVCKANYILNDTYQFPTEYIDQTILFSKQYSKYIDKKCPKVAVLSAFPMFVLEYYGIENLKKKLYP